jgi:VCBS repeat protein
MSGKGKSVVAGVVLVASLVAPAASAQTEKPPRDVTGDGYADILARDADGRLWLFPNSRTDEPYSWVDREIVGADYLYVDAIMWGDINLDGRVDLVVREPGRDNGILWAVVRDKDDTTWTKRIYFGTGWNIGASLATGDVNGDGRDDVVLRESNGNLWLYPHGGRTDAFPLDPRQLIGTNWQNVTALRLADVTGDHHPDLVARDQDGYLWIYPHPGDDTTTEASTKNKPATMSTTMWTFGARDTTPYPAGLGWDRYDSLFLTDVTGDGRPDAVGRDSEGTLWIYPHTGATEGTNPWPIRAKAGDWWSKYTYLLG